MIATTAPIKAVIPISKPLVAKLQRLKLKEKSQLQSCHHQHSPDFTFYIYSVDQKY